VAELQKMPEGVPIKPKISKGGKGQKARKAAAKAEEGGSTSVRLARVEMGKLDG
jgi:formamidopyrimidine-DNA glycosylase